MSLSRRLILSLAVVVSLAVATPAGAVSGERHITTPATFTTPVGGQHNVAIASNGNGYLAVWEDGRAQDGGRDIFATRLTAAGEILDPQGIPVAIAANDQTFPDVAWDGTNYVVVWDDDREEVYETDVYAARVSADGRVLDPTPIRVAAEPTNRESMPAIASTGDGVLIAWEELWPDDADGGVRARHMAADGTLAAETVTVASGTGFQRAPAVAASATGYLIAYNDSLVLDGDTTDIRAARLSATGQLLGDTITVHSSGTWQDSIAADSDGRDFLVAWSVQTTDSGADLRAARVAADGGVIDAEPFVVAGTPADENGAAVSFNGSQYQVTWVHRDQSPDVAVMARRYLPSTSAVDAPPLTVATGLADDSHTAAAANTAGQWLLGFSLSNVVNAVRVSPVGTVVAPPQPMASAAPAQLDAAIAGGAEGSLAVWQEWNGTDYDIHAARLGPNGRPLTGESLAVASGPAKQTEPDVAWDGRRYLVVWRHETDDGLDIRGAVVTANGTVRADELLSTAEGTQYRPAVAGANGVFFVAWEETRDGPAFVRGAVVRRGRPAARMTVTRGRGDRGTPDVATDGRRFLVVWEDERSGNFEIHAARVTRRGRVLDPRSIQVTNAPNPQVLPSVAWNGAHYVAVWSDARRDWAFDVYGARIGAGGRVLDRRGFAVARGRGSLQNPVIARHGSRTFVAWQTVTGAGSDIVGRAIRRSGELRARRTLSALPGVDEAFPAVSRGARRVIVLYQRFDADPRVHSPRVFVRRL